MSAQGARPSGGRRGLFFGLMLALVVLVPALVYLGIVSLRGSYAYYQFKIRGHAWVGQMWQADPDLGYAHVPGFRGRQSISEGFAVDVHIDEDGFRVPVQDPPSNPRPLVLALGDSIAFGQACEAEETYAFLVAKALNGTVVNSGVSGHWLSQMWMRAEDIIASLRAAGRVDGGTGAKALRKDRGEGS